MSLLLFCSLEFFPLQSLVQFLSMEHGADIIHTYTTTRKFFYIHYT